MDKHVVNCCELNCSLGFTTSTATFCEFCYPSAGYISTFTEKLAKEGIPN